MNPKATTEPAPIELRLRAKYLDEISRLESEIREIHAKLALLDELDADFSLTSIAARD